MQAQGFQSGRPGFSRDMTDADLSSHLKSVTSAGGLHINFFYKKVKVKSRDAAVNGQVETRLCVSKQPKGDRSTVSVRFITEERAQRDFPVEFALFKQYEEIPTTGTPLEELPGISMSQIGMLVLNGLRSVEDLIEVSEDQIGQLGLDAIKARKTAISWTNRRNDMAEEIDAADIEARYSIQSETLKGKLSVAEERIKQLEAQNEALQMARGAGVAANTPAANEPMGVNGEEDLEYDLSNMPDPMSEGPATTDGDDDLGNRDPDPLTED